MLHVVTVTMPCPQHETDGALTSRVVETGESGGLHEDPEQTL